MTFHVLSSWLELLESTGLDGISRVCNVAIDLNDPWLVSNSLAVIWNLGYHLLVAQFFDPIHDTLLEIYEAFRRVGFAGYSIILQ